VPAPVSAPTNKPNAAAPVPAPVPAPTTEPNDDDYDEYYYAAAPSPAPTTEPNDDDYDGYYYYYGGYNSASFPVGDDTVASATSTGTISCGDETISGTIDSGSLYYDFTVTETTMLTLSTCNSQTELDTVIYLINEERDTIVAYSDDDYDCNDGSRKSTFIREVVPGEAVRKSQELKCVPSLTRFCLPPSLRELPHSGSRVWKLRRIFFSSPIEL